MRFFIKFLYQASRMLWLLFKPVSMGVRIMMIRDKQVVLVKHVYEPYWYLPGGAVERGETLESAVRREAREETGATLQDLALFGVYTNNERGKIDHVAVFLSQTFEFTCQGDDEIEYCRLFPLDALPEKISPGSANRVREYLDGKTSSYGDW
jgi:ADP-ribose pyrophosphatase YjhB (NUDIX family)